MSLRRLPPLTIAFVISFIVTPVVLPAPGEVLAHQKISSTEGGFEGFLNTGVQFGTAVASLGDVDGDGVGDLAVGSLTDDDGGTNRGAVWVLFLNTDGTVKGHQKISSTVGGFEGPLDDNDQFGHSTAPLGDLDGDGVVDLAVGTTQDDDGGSNRGAVWFLFLNSDGTVKSHEKISSTEGGFSGPLRDNDRFGISVTLLGDLNGDTVDDLAVGAQFDNDGGFRRGAVWILFLNSDGTVSSHQKISDTQGGFTGSLDDGEWFGYSLASLGDLDGDEVLDLAAGAVRDDDGGFRHGSLWVLFLNADGTVKSHQKISSSQGGFSGIIDDEDLFAHSITSMGDVDGDGVADLAVGAVFDDDGGPDRGAVWVLFLNTDGTVKGHQKISATEGGFTGTLDALDRFGNSVALLGDLDNDGLGDLAVGTLGDDDGGSSAGAVWILFLDGVPDQCLTVVSETVTCNPNGSMFTYDVEAFNVCTGATQMFSFTGSGGAVGEDFCFSVIVTDDAGGFCCATQLCAPVPDCSEAEAASDLDGDGITGILDFLALLAAWGSCSDCGNCPADFDGDCSVGILDLLILLGNWV